MAEPPPEDRRGAAGDSTETIGPYEVLGRLGRGGMGEVLLARDPRLGRKVAIKRVRAGGGEESRRRFQREARLAAALSHPAIVPIYDLVVAGEHEHLVMELVEGPSLALWLEEPRRLASKLQIAEEIAAGLAYAHRQGIVHRDLKTENVLLSGEDHAKIADFGIARRDTALLPAEPGETAQLETRGGVLLGTYRTMAPEQARGGQADARSDLFSFGVLLYEMFTGESPFEGPSPLETLYRLANKPHPDLSVLAPGLPPGLARLIDQLLEKDPALRPQSAHEVAQRLAALRRELADREDATVEGALPLAKKAPAERPPGFLRRHRGALLAGLVTATVAAAAYLLWPQPAEPLYAAVLPARWAGSEAAGEAGQQLLFTVRSAALRQLSGLQGISPKSSDELDQVAGVGGAPPGEAQVAEAVGADELVRPIVSCAGSDCELRLERWRLADRALVTVAKADLPTDDPALAARAAEAAARSLYPRRQPRGGRAAEPPSDQAMNRLLAIRHALASGPDSDLLAGWIAELRALREKDPGFYELALLEVELLRRRYAETHDESLREPARAAMNAALQAAPEVPDVLLRAAWLAILDERPRDAETFLTRAEQSAPGDLRVVDQRALLLERSGRLEESLALRRAAIARRPSWTRSYNLAFVLFRLARWDEARRVLDELLAASPGHGRALSLRARIEMAGGDPREAVKRYQDLLTRGESLIDRSNLATAYLLLGDGARAAEESAKVLANAPSHPYYILALADARSLEGRAEEATALYRRVLELEQGEDPQSLTVRAQAHARLGENDEALALLQQAIRKAPGFDGQLAFESALIYTLVGDRSSAKVNLRETVRQGWGGWLRLSPFARWQDDPEIGPLLAAARADAPKGSGPEGAPDR